MEKNRLEVTIKGAPKSGKTSLAYMLSYLLDSLGIKSSVSDDSIPSAVIITKILTGKGKSLLVGRTIIIQTMTASGRKLHRKPRS